MGYRRGLVHCIARCKECDWYEEDYNAAKSEAKKHLRKTGHSVTVDEGVVTEYWKDK